VSNLANSHSGISKPRRQLAHPGFRSRSFPREAGDRESANVAPNIARLARLADFVDRQVATGYSRLSISRGNPAA